MRFYDTATIRQIDAETLVYEGISSWTLMERAAEGLCQSFCGRFGTERPVLVLAGPGNNGGDGLAMARLLNGRGYRVRCRLFSGGRSISSDCQTNYEALKETDIDFARVDDLSFDESSLNVCLDDHTIVVDALFGSGLNRPLEGVFAELVRWMNRCRPQHELVSIDLPSGLFGEDNRHNSPDRIVCSDWVLSLAFPKLSLLLADNAAYVKEWALSPLAFPDAVLDHYPTSYRYTEPSEMATLLSRRGRFSHKGNFGHGLLLAASKPMAGASILAARSALRAGIGLLTMQVPESVYACVQSAVPEAMVLRDASSLDVLAQIDEAVVNRATAIAVGPGIGQGSLQAEALEKLLRCATCPLVLDADALNLLSSHRHLIPLLPAGTVLTPHPKEFDRLAGASSSAFERLQRAREWAVRHRVVMVLKGAHTVVISPQGELAFNSTGNAGMATAGSGDVLCGIVLALLAQGYEAYDAARLAVYLHGLSGDLALSEESEESLVAGDLIRHLGRAFKQLSRHV